MMSCVVTFMRGVMGVASTCSPPRATPQNAKHTQVVYTESFDSFSSFFVFFFMCSVSVVIQIIFLYIDTPLFYVVQYFFPFLARLLILIKKGGLLQLKFGVVGVGVGVGVGVSVGVGVGVGVNIYLWAR